MKLVDLSSPVTPRSWEPDPVELTILNPADAAKHMVEEMREHFGIEFDAGVLPGGEFLSLDTVTLTTHTGTHVDAPAHYGSTGPDGGAPTTVDELPLEWFVDRPACVVDLTDEPTGAIGRDRLEAGLEAIGYEPEPLDMVLLHTGAAERAGTPAYFSEFVGLDGPATECLLDRGVRVIGTDAFSLDAPFTDIIRRYQEGADESVLWPAHVVGRRRPYSQIERLTNLEALPSSGFTVSCVPVKVEGAGAGWARAVATIDEGSTP